MIPQSKIENLKLRSDPAERAGAGGQGDQVKQFWILDFGLAVTMPD
jgi:hypothetical protein